MTKVLVLGGGPAGYVAAGRAAQLGAEVTLVEAREIGGTCLNRGCIPTKAMVAGAARLHEARRSAEYGVLVGDVGLDFPAFMARKDAVTAQLRDGVAHLLKARKVQVVAGRATLAGPGRLVLAPGATLPDGAVLEEGGELEGDAVILASGSEPVRMGLFDWSDSRLMTSDELLRIDARPRQPGDRRRRRHRLRVRQRLRAARHRGDGDRDARPAAAGRGPAHRAHAAAGVQEGRYRRARQDGRRERRRPVTPA